MEGKRFELTDYTLVRNQRYVLIEPTRNQGEFSQMVRSSDPETFMRFLDSNGLLDGTIRADFKEGQKIKVSGQRQKIVHLTRL